MPFPSRRPGFLLIEAMLGIVVFGLFLASVGVVLLRGQEGSIAGGDRVRATMYVQRGVEAARIMRDGSFSALTVGDHGVALNAAKQWTWSGSRLTSSGFTTKVTVSSLASDWMSITATTTWKHGYARSGSVVLATELTNWRQQRSVADWSALALTGSYVVSNARFNDIAVFGNYAYVTSETSGGGAGLYVLNIANPASPSLVTTVSLGGAGYHVAIKGNILYVVAANATGEVRAYDLSAPASPSLKATYNLTGSSRGTSLAISGDRLYVGGVPNAGAAERALYVFNIGNSGAIQLMDELDDTATISAVATSGTSAYLATSDDAGELKVVNALSGSNVSYIGSYNITDGSWDGLSIAVSGTSALLGRAQTSMSEIALFHLKSGAVPTTPGPWYHEGSGSVVGLDVDGNGCYAFVAASSGRKALQVVNLYDKSLPEVTTYTSTNGRARGVFYDHRRDKVFLLTDSAVLIFKGTGPGPGNCPA